MVLRCFQEWRLSSSYASLSSMTCLLSSLSVRSIEFAIEFESELRFCKED